MMLRILTTLAMVGVAIAAVAQGPAEENPAYPGQCYLREENKAIRVGEEHQFQDCSIVRCAKNDGELWVFYESCGLVGVPDTCQAEYDNSLPYPDCCEPRIVCNDVAP